LDYRAWKTHFGDTFDDLAAGSGSGSQSLAGTVESESLAELEPVSKATAVDRKVEAVDAGILLATARPNAQQHGVRGRIAGVGRVSTDSALVAWLATRNRSQRHESANHSDGDSFGDPAGECRDAKAADAVFSALGDDLPGV
jgi:hypothetical protein